MHAEARSRLPQFSNPSQIARARLPLAKQNEFFVLGFVGTVPAKIKTEFFGIKTTGIRVLVV
jgi:hypothetical protein